MDGIIRETITVFAVLQLLFGYLEFKYKPDIIYVAGRLLTARKYFLPSLVLPLVYFVFRIVVDFLFVA